MVGFLHFLPSSAGRSRGSTRGRSNPRGRNPLSTSGRRRTGLQPERASTWRLRCQRVSGLGYRCGIAPGIGHQRTRLRVSAVRTVDRPGCLACTRVESDQPAWERRLGACIPLVTGPLRGVTGVPTPQGTREVSPKYSYQSYDAWSFDSYIDPSRRSTTLEVSDRYMYGGMTSVPLRSSIILCLDWTERRLARPFGSRRSREGAPPDAASSSRAASQSARLLQGAGYC